METNAQPYPLGEEIANSITHGLGAALSIAGLSILVMLAATHGNAWHVVGCTIFGATLVTMYVASTLYHGIAHHRAKQVLQILDHSAIYLVIAGTYTPFMIVSLRGTWGWTLLALIWAAAIGGIALRAAFGRRAGILRVVLYVVMGWAGVLVFRPLMLSLGPVGVSLVVGGGIVYTAGVGFYGWERLRYHHTIWHVFVLVGSLLHFFAVLFYVIPWPAR